MDFRSFQTASLGQLALMTDIDRHRWSRYLSGKVGITDKTLVEVAPKLGMSPGELLAAILKRRENYSLCDRST